jgi:RNA polymerase sigma factor (sigma-70 family)
VPSLHSRKVCRLAAVPSPVGRSSFAGGPARAPQAAATEGLYERHAGKILSYCMHQLGSREEAEDAVQTTFMNAFRALGRGVVPEAESAWLFKIAENVCLSRRRSSWRRGRIESPSDFDVIEEVVPGPSRQRDELIGIEDALASMPEQQRRAILLREWQGLSYREISDELELSQSAVETLIFRARRSLAQGLEQPDLIKKPKRKGFRRALHMIDLGTVAAAAKTLLTGSVAVKATATAVAVTAVATAASVTPKLEGHSPKSAQPPAQVAPSTGAAVAPGGAAFAPSVAAAHADATARQVTPTGSSVPAKPATAKRPDNTFRAATPTVPTTVPAAAPTHTPAAAAPAAEPAGPSAAPAEPAQQPVSDQPIVAPAAPAAQPGREEPKPVAPALDEGTPTTRTSYATPVASPTAPTAPIFAPSPSDLKPAPAPTPEASVTPVAVVSAPVAPTPAADPVTDSLFGGSTSSEGGSITGKRRK